MTSVWRRTLSCELAADLYQHHEEQLDHVVHRCARRKPSTPLTFWESGCQGCTSPGFLTADLDQVGVVVRLLAGSRNFPEWGTDPHWVPTVLGYEVWAAVSQPVYFEDITAG